MLAARGASASDGHTAPAAARRLRRPGPELASGPVPDDVVVRPDPLLMAAEQVDGEDVLPRVIAQVFTKPFAALKFCFWT